MNITFHSPEDGFSKRQVEDGTMWLFADVTCGNCGKLQSVAMTGYVGGPCIRCGEKTGECHDR